MPEEDCSQRDASNSLNSPEQHKIAKLRLQNNVRKSLWAFLRNHEQDRRVKIREISCKSHAVVNYRM